MSTAQSRPGELTWHTGRQDCSMADLLRADAKEQDKKN